MRAKANDFSQKTIAALRQRVGSRCSNPECRVPTTGPATIQHKINVIGEAAHITAASPNGPRYDAFLSSQERSNIYNGIWLCSNCSDLIDKDELCYTVPVLHRWKEYAERVAKSELGKALPTEADLQFFKGLALGSLPRTRMAEAVSKTVKVIKKEMEELDPRFVISVDHRGDITEYTLFPREPVEIKAYVDTSLENNFKEKFAKLIEHGAPLTIETKQVVFKGSALFEVFNGEEGTLSICNATSKMAIQKALLKHPKKNTTHALDDFHGELVFGTKSCTFEGAAFGGLLCIKYRIEFLPNHKLSIGNVSFELMASNWCGKNILSLPYFEKALACFKYFSDGWNIDLVLEVDGKAAFRGQSTKLIQKEGPRYTYLMLEHIRIVRDLSRFFGISILFLENSNVSEEDLRWLEYLHRLIIQDKNDKKNTIESVFINVSPACVEEQSGLEGLLQCGEPTAVRFEHRFERAVNFLGTLFFLPSVMLVYSKAYVRPYYKNSRPKLNKIIKVKVLPKENCNLTIYRSDEVI
ncbi:MAG: hypothetical protein V4695_13015 [Pseudomonadota bacterium]